MLNKKTGARRENQIQRESAHEAEVEALPVCGVVDHWIIVAVRRFFLSIVKLSFKVASGIISIKTKCNIFLMNGFSQTFAEN